MERERTFIHNLFRADLVGITVALWRVVSSSISAALTCFSSFSYMTSRQVICKCDDGFEGKYCERQTVDANNTDGKKCAV